MSQTDLLNVDALSLFVEMGKDMVTSLVNLYIKDSHEQTDHLLQQLKANHTEEALKNAHSMKGSSFNIGANAMGETCLQIEKLIKENKLSDAETLAESLPELLEQTRLACFKYIEDH
jgi:HPt (histidine-containing phosphotransfer) domain-containing protein